MSYTLEERRQIAAQRKQRVRGYLTQSRPPSFKEIQAREGVSPQTLRPLINQLEEELGLSYFGTDSARGPGSFGLTDASRALRARLADALHSLGSDRAEVAALTGLNRHEQIRAINRPFRHDWTVSQIERLATATGRSMLEMLQ